jgi:N-acetylglucosaminyldiphosphoundecaprenol N-acetyl-beta-D-mannosaminyltransferase
VYTRRVRGALVLPISRMPPLKRRSGRVISTGASELEVTAPASPNSKSAIFSPVEVSAVVAPVEESRDPLEEVSMWGLVVSIFKQLLSKKVSANVPVERTSFRMQEPSIAGFLLRSSGFCYDIPVQPPRVHVLGVPIDPVTQEQALSRLLEMLRSSTQHHVMTPNSEMLVEAHKNSAFRELLNRSALNLPDSAGLLWMARLTGQRLPKRVTGVDTVQALCKELPAFYSVFLLGAAPGVAELAAKELRKMNPELHIVETYSGSPRPEDAEQILRRIETLKPHLLFVAFGAPTQDLWIDTYLSQMPSVRVAMGVGGTFDFLAGKRKRAPRVLQIIGLEWLWRLVLEPSRWKRIWNAVVVFPVLVLFHGKK